MTPIRTWTVLALTGLLLLGCVGSKASSGNVSAGKSPSAVPSATTSTQDANSPCQAQPQDAEGPVNGRAVSVIAPLSADTIAVSFNDRVEVNAAGDHWTTVYLGSDREHAYVRDLQWLGSRQLLVAATDGLFRVDLAPACVRKVSGRTDVYHIHFLDQNRGWGVLGPEQRGQLRSPNPLLKTIDGGASWTPVETGLKTVNWVQFIDPQTGFAAGPEGVVATSNGGGRWNHGLVLDGNRMQGSSAQLAFRDRLHGFAYYLGPQGMLQESVDLWYTSDGGRSWKLQACSCGFIASPYRTEQAAKAGVPGGLTTLLSVTGPASSAVASWGPSGPNGGHVRYCASADSGLKWSCADVPGASQLSVSLAHWGPQVAWLVSGRTLLQSRDAGASWRILRDLT